MGIMSKIIEYRSKKDPNLILQVHKVENLDSTRVMYRIKRNNDFAKAILISLGVHLSHFDNEFKDIEEQELEKQIKEFGWIRIRKQKTRNNTKMKKRQ